MFSIRLQNADQTRTYSIASLNHAGWEVTLEREGELTRRVYDDWHRVERALARFRLEVNQLREQGWHEARP
jgi:hypothetical protein